MIQEATKHTLQSNMPTQAMSVELNSTVADILMNSSYTNKVAAVIREVSTNAIDACLAADLPIRFKSHVPTQLEPWFSVRDFGTGLSKEDMTGLYSTFGASTKRESNVYNGTFGIGRMSMLAYAPSFTVTSYYNGTKYNYLISTADGLPSIVLLGSEPTKEPNGLGVKVSVQQADIQEFHREASSIYQWFKHKPECNIKLTTSYDDTTIVAKGADWFLQSKDYHSKGTPLIIMGNVAYQVDEVVKHKLADSTLLAEKIRIFAPIGAVSVNAGRESLQLDDKTVKYLNQTFERIIKELSASVNKAIAGKKTGWEAIKEFNTAIDTLPSSVAKSVVLTHNGIPDINKFTKTYSNKYRLGKHTLTHSGLDIKVYYRHRKTGKSFDKWDELGIADDVHFVVADQATGHIAAVDVKRDELRNSTSNCSNIKAVILIRPQGRWKKEGIATYEKQVKYYLKSIGNPPTTKVSELVDSRTITVKVNKAKDDFQVKYVNHHASRESGKITSHILGNYFDLVDRKNTTFVYYKTSGHTLDDYTEEDLILLSGILYDPAHRSNAGDIKLVKVPNSKLNVVAGDSRFIELSEYLAKTLKGEIYDLTPLLGYNTLLTLFETKYSKMPIYAVEQIPELDKHPLMSSLKIVMDIRKTKICLPSSEKLEASLGFKLKTINLPIAGDEISTFYPLLDSFTNARNISFANINEYLKLQDFYNQRKGVTK